MDAETRLSGFGLLLLGLLGIIVAFAVSASVGDGLDSVEVAPAEPRAVARLSTENAGVGVNQAAQGAPRNTAPSRAIRTKLYCSNCGVVESVRRVERRVIAPAICPALDSERFWARDDIAYGIGTLSLVSDNGGFAARLGATKTALKPSYQIVVRFRDGSSHVFNEATPRTLQSGERVQVIAGPGWTPKGRA